jgi:hypothetical protein
MERMTIGRRKDKKGKRKLKTKRKRSYTSDLLGCQAILSISSSETCCHCFKMYVTSNMQ